MKSQSMNFKTFSASCILVLNSLLLAACGQVENSASSLSAADEASCEVAKKLDPRADSAFPANANKVIRVVSATAKADCVLGGFGWTVNSWSYSFQVEVANLDYNKRFVVEDPSNPIDSFRKVIDASKVQFTGKAIDGFDQFSFEVKETRLKSLKLSVIMPAVFNETPNIGNPVPGWNGPSYGLTLDPINLSR